MHYEDSLEALFPLAERRLRGDLIQFYKIQNGLNIVNWVNPIVKRPALESAGPARAVRGSSHAIERQIIRNCEPRYWFLSNRIAPLWNALPSDIVNSNSTYSFKNKLDKFLNTNKKFLASYLSTIADGSR